MKQLFILALLLLAIPCFSQSIDDATLKSLADQLEIEATSSEAPVSMNAKVFSTDEGATQKNVLVVKVNVHENWHIYAYVPEGGFFVQSEIKLDLPEGVEADLVKEPKTKAYDADPQIMLYKGDLLFVYELKADELTGGEHNITTTLYYQPCDPYVCLPPNEITVKYELKVEGM